MFDRAREIVVARHLIALDHLFTRDDIEGCLAEFVAAAGEWSASTAAPESRSRLRKSWSLALEGAIVAGRHDLAATIAGATADAVVAPEYDDEYVAAACLEIWCRAKSAVVHERLRIESLCAKAEQYLGASHPLFDLFRAVAGSTPDFAARFDAWHVQHVNEIDERLAGPRMRPFEVMLAHCWTKGLAVLRCARWSGIDLEAGGLLVARRFLPATLLSSMEEPRG